MYQEVEVDSITTNALIFLIIHRPIKDSSPDIPRTRIGAIDVKVRPLAVLLLVILTLLFGSHPCTATFLADYDQPLDFGDVLDEHLYSKL